jgi:hypothetical protein
MRAIRAAALAVTSRAEAAAAVAVSSSSAAAAATAALPVSGGAHLSLKRRLASGPPQRNGGGGGGNRGGYSRDRAPAGGGDRRGGGAFTRRSPSAAANEFGGDDEDGDDNDGDARSPTDPAVVAERLAKTRAATAYEYDPRVPVDFGALEDAEYDDAIAAAAQAPGGGVAGARNPAAAWRGDLGAPSSAKGARRAGGGGSDPLADAAAAIFANPDAAARVGVPSPQDRVTSLADDPYGWPLSARLPKEAPLWMLYQAQREEVPLRDVTSGAGKAKAQPPVGA